MCTDTPGGGGGGGGAAGRPAPPPPPPPPPPHTHLHTQRYKEYLAGNRDIFEEGPDVGPALRALRW
jgi:hypothetical protein